jgi:N-acetylneuraminic acid mutarotase
MRRLPILTQLVALLLSFPHPGALAEPPSHAPQDQATLPQMLEMQWSAGPHLPQGMQDNHVAEIGGWLVNVLGFCSGSDDDWKPGRYPRGFLNKAWALNLRDEGAGWTPIPNFPGAPRQAGQGVVVRDALYLWGGFSYDEPYTYTDGYRLTHEGDAWQWSPLPPLPSPTCWTGMAAIGSRIYALGGADYDAQRFYCLQDRTGTVPRLGARMLSFDTDNPAAGWVPASPCPGTPRCLAGTAVIDGQIYILGGITMLANGGYANVVDNWRYDPATDTWTRLRDLPFSGSGTSAGSLVFQNRYILLPAGYQYGVVLDPEGRELPAYGTPQRIERTWKQHPTFESTHYYNHFYVYDTKTDTFGTATPLPFDDVASITVVRGDTMYLFPGETAGFVWEGEYFGHHPEFVLKGAITERPWE